MLEHVNLIRALEAGFVAAALMAIVGYGPRLLGQPVLDFGAIIEAKIFRYHSRRGTAIGLLVHVGNGMLLALLYAVFPHQRFGAPALLTGISWGLVLWLVAMLVVLPRLGEGVFGHRMGPAVRITSLLMHLVYGLTLGVVYAY